VKKNVPLSCDTDGCVVFDSLYCNPGLMQFEF